MVNNNCYTGARGDGGVELEPEPSDNTDDDVGDDKCWQMKIMFFG